MGIDPGLGRCGYAFIQQKGTCPTVMNYGVIATGKDEPLAERLRVLRGDLLVLLNQHHPTHVAVEAFHPNSGIRGAASVMVLMARGVILETLVGWGIQSANIAEPYPQTWKRDVANKGNARKDVVRNRLACHMDLPWLRGVDDSIDAIGIALWYLWQMRYAE